MIVGRDFCGKSCIALCCIYVDLSMIVHRAIPVLNPVLVRDLPFLSHPVGCCQSFTVGVQKGSSMNRSNG